MKLLFVPIVGTPLEMVYVKLACFLESLILVSNL